ncbi:helix-turn-helix domain-containing protein [Demequina iriomotensis]|uniref:helix-turn-helix domain-containing protein n=1 Tax=Demequina iriomotensis TaxID=1536641 RepID=UPI000783DEB2|nr:helix-turn-helix domain-containing protein [Demequina iriomotensis]
MARITEEQVAEVRRRVESGERRLDVAEALGISKASVDSIMSGRRGGPSRRAGTLTGEDKARIVTLAAAGMSQTAIAREVGTSQQMVSKLLKERQAG